MAKTHPIFSQDPNALEIILYYDDISLTASRAKRNKLGMFYFTLGALAETHPIFSQDPNALEIILYYDDISLTASRAKRNKLGMFYFT